MEDAKCPGRFQARLELAWERFRGRAPSRHQYMKQIAEILRGKAYSEIQPNITKPPLPPFSIVSPSWCGETTAAYKTDIYAPTATNELRRPVIQRPTKALDKNFPVSE